VSRFRINFFLESKRCEAKRSLRSSCSRILKQNFPIHVFSFFSLGSHQFFRFRFASIFFFLQLTKRRLFIEKGVVKGRLTCAVRIICKRPIFFCCRFIKKIWSSLGKKRKNESLMFLFRPFSSILSHGSVHFEFLVNCTRFILYCFRFLCRGHFNLHLGIT